MPTNQASATPPVSVEYIDHEREMRKFAIGLVVLTGLAEVPSLMTFIWHSVDGFAVFTCLGILGTVWVAIMAARMMTTRKDSKWVQIIALLCGLALGLFMIFNAALAIALMGNDKKSAELSAVEEKEAQEDLNARKEVAKELAGVKGGARAAAEAMKGRVAHSASELRDKGRALFEEHLPAWYLLFGVTMGPLAAAILLAAVMHLSAIIFGRAEISTVTTLQSPYATQQAAQSSGATSYSAPVVQFQAVGQPQVVPGNQAPALLPPAQPAAPAQPSPTLRQRIFGGQNGHNGGGGNSNP